VRTRTTRYDYGECEICNTPLEEKCIKQDFWLRGELIVMEGVPTGVCPQCGEKVVKADVGRRLATLMDDSERIAAAARIQVPALRFEEQEVPM
jgi:YgiT-type zinc finger domain-containing protein